MKRTIIIKMLLCIMFGLSTSSKLLAQRNKNKQDAIVAGAAVLGGIIATKIAIEDMKEQLEEDAVTHILTNHPEIKNFRLKCLFERGEKWSDESGTGVLTFQITILNKAKKTSERKVLLRFNNKNFINQNGIRINKIEYRLVDVNEWNSMMAFFGNLISIGDSILPLKSNSTDSYNYYNVPLYNSSKCSIDGAVSSKYYNLLGDDREVCFIKSGLSIPISNVNFVKHAFEYTTDSYLKEIYPFHKLKGDDYIVGNYSSEIRIFANENSMGLFLKRIGKTVLLRRYIIGEIHTFLNFHNKIKYSTKKIDENVDSDEIVEDTILETIKQPGLYYKGRLCVIINKISDDEVKIKYATETGRGFYKELVKLSELKEVKSE